MAQFSLCSLRRKLLEAYESGVKMKFRQARGNSSLCVCVFVCVWLRKLSRDRRKHESEERTNSVKISHIQMTRHYRACEHCQIPSLATIFNFCKWTISLVAFLYDYLRVIFITPKAWSEKKHSLCRFVCGNVLVYGAESWYRDVLSQTWPFCEKIARDFFRPANSHKTPDYRPSWANKYVCISSDGGYTIGKTIGGWSSWGFPEAGIWP